MIWLHVCGAVLVSWITLISLGVTLHNSSTVLNPHPEENIAFRKKAAFGSFAVFVLSGYLAIAYWMHIYTVDSGVIRIYFGILIAAYLVRLLTLGLRGDLGYLLGSPFEPDWEEMYTSLFAATFGPLVLIWLAIELHSTWRRRNHNRRK